jgi:hypothetical protein
MKMHISEKHEVTIDIVIVNVRFIEVSDGVYRREAEVEDTEEYDGYSTHPNNFLPDLVFHYFKHDSCHEGWENFSFTWDLSKTNLSKKDIQEIGEELEYWFNQYKNEVVDFIEDKNLRVLQRSQSKSSVLFCLPEKLQILVNKVK